MLLTVRVADERKYEYVAGLISLYALKLNIMKILVLTLTNPDLDLSAVFVLNVNCFALFYEYGRVRNGVEWLDVLNFEVVLFGNLGELSLETSRREQRHYFYG